MSIIDSGHLVGLKLSKKRRSRRLRENEEKTQIMAQTRVPDVSVLQTVPRYEVNADFVFKWLRDPRFNWLVEDNTAVSFFAVEVVTELPILGFPLIDVSIVDALVIEAAVTGS